MSTYTHKTFLKACLIALLASLAIAATLMAFSVSGANAEVRINVTDYGATRNDSTNDTRAFEAAMVAAAASGGVAYVPGPGVYRIFNLKQPSGSDLEVEATATLKKYGTSNGPLFRWQGPSVGSFLRDVHVRGVNGDFTLDLSDAGAQTPGFRIRNVQGFSIEHMKCIQNDSRQNTLPPTSSRPCITVLSRQSEQLASGLYSTAYDGTLRDLHGTHAPYGWGLMQFSGGQRIQMRNVSGEGGIPLRLENFEGNVTPMKDITVDGLRCINGHSAVNFNPHGFAHKSNINLRNVTATSCESGAVIKGFLGTYGPNVTIDGLTVIPGDSAQLRDSNTSNALDAWVIGRSRWCVDDDASYPVAITNLSCGGLPND
jgi:hypothetical protein